MDVVVSRFYGFHILWNHIFFRKLAGNPLMYPWATVWEQMIFFEEHHYSLIANTLYRDSNDCLYMAVAEKRAGG